MHDYHRNVFVVIRMNCDIDLSAAFAERRNIGAIIFLHSRTPKKT